MEPHTCDACDGILGPWLEAQVGDPTAYACDCTQEETMDEIDVLVNRLTNVAEQEAEVEMELADMHVIDPRRYAALTERRAALRAESERLENRVVALEALELVAA